MGKSKRKQRMERGESSQQAPMPPTGQVGNELPPPPGAGYDAMPWGIQPQVPTDVSTNTILMGIWREMQAIRVLTAPGLAAVTVTAPMISGLTGINPSMPVQGRSQGQQRLAVREQGRPARPRHRPRTVCARCGHWHSANCADGVMACYRCGQEGHLSRTCQRPRTSSSTGTSSRSRSQEWDSWPSVGGSGTNPPAQ